MSVDVRAESFAHTGKVAKPLASIRRPARVVAASTRLLCGSATLSSSLQARLARSLLFSLWREPRDRNGDEEGASALTSGRALCHESDPAVAGLTDRLASGPRPRGRERGTRGPPPGSCSHANPIWESQSSKRCADDDRRWRPRIRKPALRALPTSGRRVSNPRPSAWEADALPTELRPRCADFRAPPTGRGLDLRHQQRQRLPATALDDGRCRHIRS